MKKMEKPFDPAPNSKRPAQTPPVDADCSSEIQKLRHERDRLQACMDTVEAMIVTLDAEGKITAINKAGCRLLGYREDELLGRSWFDACLPAPSGREIVYPVFQKLMAGEIERTQYFENPVMTRTGELRYIAWHNALIRDAQGKIIGALSSGDDITLRKEAEEALRKSEEKHRNIYDNAVVGMYRSKIDGSSVLEANQALCDILEYTREEILSEPATLRWKDLDARNEMIRQLNKDGRITNYEADFVTKNGNIRNCVMSVKLYPREGYLEGTTIDITARRLAEENYHRLFHEMLDGFALHEIICDALGRPVDYRYLAVNPAFESMTGLQAKDIVGHTVRDVLPGTEQFWIDTYGKVAITGKPAFFENYSESLKKHFEVRAFRPAPNQFACIFADITLRKQAEETIRDSEEKFARAFEKAPMLMIISSLEDGMIIDINEEVTRLSGYTREEAIGRKTHELGWIKPEDRIHLVRELDQTDLTGGGEIEAQDRNGKKIHCLVFREVITISGHKRLLTLAQNITDRKRMEEERSKLEEQLRQSLKLEAIGRLAGGVAHDFNNMLAVIIGHAELALDHIDPATPPHADLLAIRKATEHSAGLVRQLLAFARKQTVLPRVLNINETVEGMTKILKRLIGEDVDLAWQPEANLWPVKIDPGQIEQILANLCINARDAIAGQGKIALATQNIVCDNLYPTCHQNVPAGDYVLLTVTDTGSGMDSATLAKIFEPFFTTKEIGKGSGLGLSTVYGIVSQNSGAIDVISAPGRGTTFLIYLPRHVGDQENNSEAAAAAQTETGHETILLVEDDPALLKMTEAMLTRLGYAVLAAASPDAAIRLACEHRGEIRMLVTDVIMPGMNGRDLADKLCSLFPGLLCLFMSGYTADVIAKKGVLDEGIHFIQKPFQKKDLAAKVRELLDRH